MPRSMEDSDTVNQSNVPGTVLPYAHSIPFRVQHADRLYKNCPQTVPASTYQRSVRSGQSDFWILVQAVSPQRVQAAVVESVFQSLSILLPVFLVLLLTFSAHSLVHNLVQTSVQFSV